MAAESEIQDFLNKAPEVAKVVYHTVMSDGSVAAIGREAVKDIRNTIHEIFFGRGEHGAEAGTPLNPLFRDIVETRNEHEAALEALSTVTPADLTERQGTVHGQQNQPQQTSLGQELPADVRADVKAAAADVKDSVKDSQTEVGREQLGQLPTQDPPRQRLKL